MPLEKNHFYRFGSFRLDPAKRLLLRGQSSVPLMPKAFDTLLVLVESRGRLVGKEELMKILWPDSFVEEANLAQNVAVLRKALGDSPEEHRYILTVPGRGYRFAAKVSEETEDEDTELVVERHSRSRVILEESTLRKPRPTILAAFLTLLKRTRKALSRVSASRRGRSPSGFGRFTRAIGNRDGTEVRDVGRRCPDICAAHRDGPNLPPKLEEIIGKALEKDRDLRYQGAGDLRAGLRPLKRDTDSGRAVAAVPSLPAAPRKARLPRVVAVLAGLATLAGLAVGWLVWRPAETLPKLSERQITANPPEDWVSGAAISPDGEHIAYHDQTGLYVRSIDSGETHAISLPTGFQGWPWGLRWFPDSGKLLAGVTSSEGMDLWVITILGTAAPHLLYRHGAEPAISPDGQSVAFVGVDETTGRLAQDVWVGGINGEAPRKLVSAEEPGSLISPVWSPDGRWIAYVMYGKTAQGSRTSAIEVRPADGGSAKTLVSESSLSKSSSPCYLRFPSCLGWSPDWRLVFSVSQHELSGLLRARSSLWEVPAEPRTGEAAGKPEQLTPWSDFFSHELAIAADGKRLSLLKTRIWQDVYLAELGSDGASMSPPRRLTLDNRGIRSLDSWMLDSQAILFSSDQNGKSGVFRQGLNESVAEAIVRGPEGDYGAGVSPDGSWMLYAESTLAGPGAPPSEARLMRRPAAGGSPEMVLEEPAGMLWEFRCPLKPGSSCVLSQKEGKDLVFYSLDPVRGKGERLEKMEVSAASFLSWNVSPDGSRLALVDLKYKGRIEVLTFSDRAWHEVSAESGWGDLTSVAWAADGKGFFVASWLPDSFNLLHVTLTGKVKPLLRNAHRQWMDSPLPSPDGKYLAFQAQTWDSNVWMLENF